MTKTPMQASDGPWPVASVSRACINCQKRKSRCLRRNPTDASCSYCTRTGKACSFENPPNRTPLTRKNLDAVELQCTQLRTLLRSLNPDLDIDAALRDMSVRSDGISTMNADRNVPAQDDRSPHDFEWHESSLSPESKTTNGEPGASDGMATLSAHTSGYLGSSSGSQLLDEIATIVSDVDMRRELENNQNHTTVNIFLNDRRTFDPPDLHLSAIASRLIDAYFLFYNVSYPILHEKTFKQMAANGRHRQGNTPWRVVYYMVLAIGHWLSIPESDHTRSVYYPAARSSMSLSMLESGTVETVQAFLLMGNYLQKRDRTNTGYNFIGLASRMALGLGLHRKSTRAENTIAHEQHRQLFWTIYCFDSGFNITTGRPPTLAEGFIDTRLPQNIDDKELPSSSPIPPEVNYPTTYSAIIAQAGLASIAEAIYCEFLLAKTAGTKIEYQVAEMMEQRLTNWRKNLPEYFNSLDIPQWFHCPRAVVLWKEQNLRILLWRGSKDYHSFLPTKINGERKCIDAAMQTIHDIATFCLTYDGALHQGVVWYATYFLFQATLVLEASFLMKETIEAPELDGIPWQHSVGQARDCLKSLANMKKSAARCLEILDRIHSWLRTATAPDSRTTQVSNGFGNAFIEQPTNVPSEVTGPAIGDFSAENNFAFFGDDQFNFSDDVSDPTLRMLINQTSLDCLDSMPLDLLLSEWTN